MRQLSGWEARMPARKLFVRLKASRTDLQRVRFADSKVPGQRGIESEIMRAGDVVAAQSCSACPARG